MRVMPEHVPVLLSREVLGAQLVELVVVDHVRTPFLASAASRSSMLS